MFDYLSWEKIKRLLAFALLNLFGIFIIYELRDFISPFLGSVIFYVLFKKYYLKLVQKRHWKKSLAALLIIFISFVIVMIPVMVTSFLMYSKITQAIHDPSTFTNFFELLDKKVMNLTGVEIFTSENIETMKIKLGNLIPSVLYQTLWVIVGILIMYVILYFMLMNTEKLTDEVHNHLPFTIENLHLFSHELEAMTLSNAIGFPIIGVLQGTAAGIGYYFFGIESPVFWAVITGLVAFIPFAGTAIVWIPLSLFLLLTGQTWMGISLIVYSMVVVVNIDNIARIYLQNKFAHVHPLITLFGVIIGLDLFGIPGLIFGPLMLSYFIILVKLYRKVYSNHEQK